MDPKLTFLVLVLCYGFSLGFSDAQDSFCSFRRDGLYPDPSSCSKFIHCAHGQLYRRSCSFYLYFSPMTKTCDLPENVRCSQADTLRNNGFENKQRSICHLKPYGIYRDRQDCRKYIVCVNGRERRKKCPNGFKFHPTFKMCTWGKYIRCNKNSFCKTRRDGQYRNPKTCKGYIQCGNGLTFIKRCPPYMEFNSRKGRCDWPWRAKCKSGRHYFGLLSFRRTTTVTIPTTTHSMERTIERPTTKTAMAQTKIVITARQQRRTVHFKHNSRKIPTDIHHYQPSGQSNKSLSKYITRKPLIRTDEVMMSSLGAKLRKNISEVIKQQDSFTKTDSIRTESIASSHVSSSLTTSNSTLIYQSKHLSSKRKFNLTVTQILSVLISPNASISKVNAGSRSTMSKGVKPINQPSLQGVNPSFSPSMGRQTALPIYGLFTSKPTHLVNPSHKIVSSEGYFSTPTVSSTQEVVLSAKSTSAINKSIKHPPVVTTADRPLSALADKAKKDSQRLLVSHLHRTSQSMPKSDCSMSIVTVSSLTSMNLKLTNELRKPEEVVYKSSNRFAPSARLVSVTSMGLKLVIRSDGRIKAFSQTKNRTFAVGMKEQTSGIYPAATKKNKSNADKFSQRPVALKVNKILNSKYKSAMFKFSSSRLKGTMSVLSGPPFLNANSYDKRKDVSPTPSIFPISSFPSLMLTRSKSNPRFSERLFLGNVKKTEALSPASKVLHTMNVVNKSLLQSRFIQYAKDMRSSVKERLSIFSTKVLTSFSEAVTASVHQGDLLGVSGIENSSNKERSTHKSVIRPSINISSSIQATPSKSSSITYVVNKADSHSEKFVPVGTSSYRTFEEGKRKPNSSTNPLKSINNVSLPNVQNSKTNSHGYHSLSNIIARTIILFPRETAGNSKKNSAQGVTSTSTDTSKVYPENPLLAKPKSSEPINSSNQFVFAARPKKAPLTTHNSSQNSKTAFKFNETQSLIGFALLQDRYTEKTPAKAPAEITRANNSRKVKMQKGKQELTINDTVNSKISTASPKFQFLLQESKYEHKQTQLAKLKMKENRGLPSHEPLKQQSKQTINKLKADRFYQLFTLLNHSKNDNVKIIKNYRKARAKLLIENTDDRRKRSKVAFLASSICRSKYKPVCGSDFKTYINDCYLAIAACGKNLRRLHFGPCKRISLLRTERKKFSNSGRR